MALSDSALEQILADKDVADAAKELASGNLDKAAAALVGVVATALGVPPVASSALVGGTVWLWSKVVAASATEKLKREARRLGDESREELERDLRSTLRSLAAARERGVLDAVAAQLKDFQDGTHEQFEQTARILWSEFGRVHGEMASMGAALEQITRLVRAWRGHDSLLVPGTAPRPKGAVQPSALLSARYVTLDFLEATRSFELQEIERWCEDRAMIGVRLLIGPGGIGKTRLGIEVAKRRRDLGWRAGFLLGGATLPEVRALCASPEPIFAIIDYAESRADLGAIIGAAAQCTRSGAPLRVLLLARSAADWWKMLLKSSAATMDLLQAHEPLALTHVPLDGPMRRELYSRARAAFAPILGKAVPSVVPDFSDALFGRPLYLECAALAGIEGLCMEAQALLETVIEHEMSYWAHRYHALGEDFYALDDFKRRVARLMAATTLRGGALRACAANLSIAVEGPAEERFPLLATFLVQLYPGPLGFGAVEPDLLGEALVLRVLRSSDTPADYVTRVFDNASDDDVAHGFTVLSRVCAHDSDGSAARAARELLGQGLNATQVAKKRAPLAIQAALALAESREGADSAFGRILAHRLQELWPFGGASSAEECYQVGALAASLYALLPDATVSLCELAAWAARQARAGAEELQPRAAWAEAVSLRLRAVGDREGAVESADEAVEHCRRLDEASPDVWRPNLAASLTSLGTMLNEAGARDRAVAATREAVGFWRELADKNPDAFNASLAMSLTNLGNQLLDTGNAPEALEATCEAITIRRELAKTRPEVLPGLTISLNNLGTQLIAVGDLDAALRATREAVAIGRELAKTRPDAFRPNLAQSLHNLGRAHYKMMDYEGALVATREAVAIRRKLVEAMPDAFRSGLAKSLVNLALILGDLGDRQGALAEAGKAVEHLQMLAARFPEAFTKDHQRCAAWLEEFERSPDGLVPIMENDFGTDVEAALRRGDELERRGDLPGAEAAYRAADDGGSGEGASNLGCLLYERGEIGAAEGCLRRADERGSAGGAFRLGFLLDERGDLAEAEVAYERAVARGSSCAEANLQVLRKRRQAVQNVEATLRSLPPRTYELFDVVHRASMTADALTNRNHFPVGCGVSADGEFFVPSKAAALEDLEYVLQVLRAYAQQGRIVAAAMATKRQEHVGDVVTIFVEDVTGTRWCFYRSFRQTATGWSFGDLQAVNLGQSSALFTSTS